MLDVSVIIPTFNRSQRLLDALSSVARQSVQPAEVIVVDDGSTDDTRNLVAAFISSSQLNCRYHFQPNRGPGAARNLGIRRSVGAYIAFLDSDDEWHREKLDMQYDALSSNPDYLISHTMERWFRRGVHLNQKKQHVPRGGDIFEQSLRLCCVGMSTVMARKELFDLYGLFDETLRCCEDYDLWLRVSAAEKFNLVDKRFTVKHGGRPDQVSNLFRVGMDRFRIQALAKLIVSTQLDDEQRQQARHEVIKRCTIYAQGCSKHQKVAEARFYFKLADYFNSDEFSK